VPGVGNTLLTIRGENPIILLIRVAMENFAGTRERGRRPLVDGLTLGHRQGFRP
jgi:hypothetical protein